MESSSMFFASSQERSFLIRLNCRDDGDEIGTENRMPAWISKIQLNDPATTDVSNVDEDDDSQREVCLFVSKEVLSIVSPIFRQKFLEKGAISECQPISVPDVKANDFIEFLTFIFPYNGEEEITEDNVHPILKLSTKFGVEFLKKKCDTFFVAKNFSIMSKEALFEHLNLFVEHQLKEATILIIPYVARISMYILQTFRKRKFSIPVNHGVWTAIYEAKASQVAEESSHRRMNVEVAPQLCVCRSSYSTDRCRMCYQDLCIGCLSRRCGEGNVHVCRNSADCVCGFTFDQAAIETSFATKAYPKSDPTSTDLSIFMTRSEERNFCFNFKEDSMDDKAGVLIWVSKEFLSVASPVFKAMFFSGFSESRNVEPIELRGKNVGQFLEFLECLFPYRNRKEINDSNVRFVLDLADQYGVDCLLQRCSNFLTGIVPVICDAEEVFEYLLLCVNYRLLNPTKLLVPRLAALSTETLTVFKQKSGIPFNHTVWTAVFEARINRCLAEKEPRKTVGRSLTCNETANKSNCKLYKNQKEVGTKLDCKSCGKFVCSNCSYCASFQLSLQCPANNVAACCCVCAYDFDRDLLVM